MRSQWDGTERQLREVGSYHKGKSTVVDEITG